MHFLPEDPLAYEAARDEIMRKRGTVVRTLYVVPDASWMIDAEGRTTSALAQT